jgi:hypothetical protein
MMERSYHWTQASVLAGALMIASVYEGRPGGDHLQRRSQAPEGTADLTNLRLILQSVYRQMHSTRGHRGLLRLLEPCTEQPVRTVL